jgi:hypothetical protein
MTRFHPKILFSSCFPAASKWLAMPSSQWMMRVNASFPLLRPTTGSKATGGIFWHIDPPIQYTCQSVNGQRDEDTSHLRIKRWAF